MLKYICIFIALFTYSANATVSLYILNPQREEMTKYCHAEEIEKDLFLTAAHCVYKFQNETILINNKKKVEKIIYLHRYHPEFIYNQLDFALIKAKNSTFKTPQKVYMNQLLLIGNLKAKVTKVYESEFKVKIMNGELCLGDSGKGIFNQEGKIVGVLSRGTQDCSNIAYFTKALFIINNYKDKFKLEHFEKKYYRDFIKRVIQFNRNNQND